MKKLLFIIFLLPLFVSAQTEYFVKTDGSNGNTGTSIAQAWRTWTYAFSQLDAGDTLTILPGVYYSAASAAIDPYAYPTPIGASGTAAAHITIRGHPDSIAIGSFPILDCRYHEDSIPDPGWNIYNSGVNLYKVEYITLKDFRVRNVWQIDSVVSGAIVANGCANITFENLALDNIGQRGFYYTSGAWSYADSAYSVDVGGQSPAAATPYFDQPDTTRFINCDVSNVCDTLATSPGNAGDGYIIISYWGNLIQFDSCRAWNYSDDGFNIDGGKRVMNNCWTMASNKYATIDGVWSAERNGFKFGAYKNAKLPFYTDSDSIDLINDSCVIINRSLAVFCAGSGFYFGVQSDSSWNERIHNITSMYNGWGVFTRYKDTLGTSFWNSIVHWSTATKPGGGDYNLVTQYSKYFVTNSSWIDNVGGFSALDNPAFNIDSSDFLETDSATIVSRFTVARTYTGSLPTDTVPLMLSSTSDLIDGGVDGYWIGSYNGSAPDVGYHEWAGDAPPDTTIVANFSASSTSIATGGTVDFTDNSTNSPDTWAWTLTGGTPPTSAVQNPTITYNTAGTYNVQLIASKNPTNADTLLRTSYITVTDVPVAQFSASATSVVAGAWVNFTDLSTNTPTSWSWAFQGGNPSTATTQNPSVLYSTAGTYNVTLTATNAGGSDDEVKNGYITVSAASGGGYNVTISIY